MSEPPKPSMVPQFIEIVARFADTLVEMDVTTPEARSGRRRNRPTPGAVSRFRHLNMSAERSSLWPDHRAPPRRTRTSWRRSTSASRRTSRPRRTGGAGYLSSVREVLVNEGGYRGARRGASETRWPIILDQSIPSAGRIRSSLRGRTVRAMPAEE